MSVAEPVATPPSQRLFRVAARLALLAWAGFWTWFLACNAVSDWPAVQPWIGLGIVGALTVVAWKLPRIGAGALLAFAAWAAWFFAHSTALWLIVGPPCVIAALNLLGAPRSRT